MIYKKTKSIAATLIATGALSFFFAAKAVPAHAVPVQKGKGRSRATRIIGPKTLNTPGVQRYLARLRGRITNNWMLADGKNVVIISVSVTPEGAVSDLSTANSKADALAIQSATVAFEKAQPLEPLPAEANATCKLEITFTSNVDPHGDSNSNVSTKIDVIPQAPKAAGNQAAPGNQETPADPSTQSPAQN